MMLESVPQEALALILPMSISFFVGLIMVCVTGVLLLKGKAVRPVYGLACLGLPAAVGTGFGVLGSRETEGWAHLASLAPVVGLLLALALFGMLALPLAWKGARHSPRDWRSSLIVWALTFGVCFCLYMQAQVQYINLLPIVPDQASPNMVSYFRLATVALGGGMVGLMCLGQPDSSVHRQLRLIGAGSLALVVWLGEVAHTSLLDYIGLNNLAPKALEKGVDVSELVVGSYAIYEGEAVWTAGVLVFGTLMWLYAVYSARAPEEAWPKSAALACVWFVLPVVSMATNPVGQVHVEAFVLNQLATLQVEEPEPNKERSSEPEGEGSGTP